ncbi:hypothetical protein BYT27DRAFT_7210187 [Phlegmacium glaucopus]|nr:hypothetical protein BYT27DRAFT_7210187 [Phlegmacium glaucopus]
MYTRVQDHQDYPSPAPSDPPGLHSNQQPDHHLNQNSSDQIDSSIGPTRVTRRQASLKQGLLVRRVSLSTNYMRPEDAAPPSIQSHDATGARLDSPVTSRHAELHVASPHVPSLQSPYHPSTPSSMASPYSSFEHSPALSTTSGITSSSHTLDNSTSAESSKIAPSRQMVREKHKKHRLRDVDRKNICLYHLSNPNARQEDIGAFFGVERSTISKILKEKDRPSKFPEVEDEMRNSLQQWSDGGVSITDQLIRQRALSIAKSFHITPDKFKGSSGWVENFKHRHNIRRGEWLQANRVLPPDYTIHEAHSSAVPPTPVLMTYDQRMHMQGSESQSSNCLLKPSESNEDQQHDHARLSTTPAHWPETMDVAQSPHPTSAMIDPILQAQDLLSPLESDHPPSHSLQDIQHSPEIQHHQPQQLHHHHHQHHNDNHQHHDHSQQHQAVMYNAYGQPLCGPGVSPPPTIAQAEAALNLLITFLDTDGRGIIKGDERQKLVDIRCALYQAANGIPTYQRLAN